MAEAAGTNDDSTNSGLQESSSQKNPSEERMAVVMAALKEPMFHAAIQIMTYCSPILVILGLIGNTLSLFVVLQKKNRRISCCSYMTALAVCDNGSLLTLLYYWFVTIITPKQWSRPGCVVWVYAVFLMTAGSGFLLVGVTFDRFMAVCFPFKARSWCTPKRAKVIVGAIMAFVAVFYAPMAAMSNVVDGNVCAAFRFDDWPRLNATLAVINLIALPIIPFFVILFMNIRITLAVQRSQKLQGKARQQKAIQQKQGRAETTEERSTRDKQLTIMLLVVSFAYVIIILPISCRVLAYIFVDYYASAKAYALFVLLFASLNHVLFLNNTINFYLYYLTGSRFRRDFSHMFARAFARCLCKGHTEDYKMTSSTNSSSAAKKPDNTAQEVVSI